MIGKPHRALSLLVTIGCLFLWQYSAAQKEAKLFIGQTVHDFGRIDEKKGAVKHDFILRNDGQAPLELQRVTCANRVLRKTGLLRRLTWVEDGVPDALVHDAVALRGATTRADGAAWTWAFLSISTRDGELTTDFDYERRPDLVPPCTRDDCAAEQRLFPRDSGRLPGWMARLQSDDVEDAVSRTDSDGDGEAGFRRPLGRLALQPR